LIDVITVTADPIVATTTVTTMIITVIITVMTYATITAATTITRTTTMTGGTTVARINVTSATTTDVMIVVARMTTPQRQQSQGMHSTTTTKRGKPKGTFQTANREINFIICGRQATKSNRQQRSNTMEIEHVNTETPQPLRWLEYQSLSPGKTIGCTYLTSGPTRWSSTP
jgi:hypothetical protein